MRRNINYPTRERLLELFDYRDGKLLYIGQFDTVIEAYHAYMQKAAELFGKFANPG